MTEIMSKTKSEIEIERDGKELKTTKILISISNLLNNLLFNHTYLEIMNG